MVINIPIQVNEEAMTEVIKKDYEEKVIDEIAKYIKTALVEESRRRAGYSYHERGVSGLLLLVSEQIEKFLEDNRDVIIEETGKMLVEKLYRTKKFREMVDSAVEGEHDTAD